jgi:hypothetical protein
MLAGNVVGGIWTSTNGGSTWSPVNDLLPYLTISTMDASGGVVYAGTGEGYVNSLPFLFSVGAMPMHVAAWESIKALTTESLGHYFLRQITTITPLSTKSPFYPEQAVIPFTPPHPPLFINPRYDTS